MYKYKLVDPTLCVKLFLRPHYAHIWAYTLLINEGPGILNGKKLQIIFGHLWEDRKYEWNSA